MKRLGKRSPPRRLSSTSRPQSDDVKNPDVIVESGTEQAPTIASGARSGSSEGQGLARHEVRMLTAADFQQLAAVPG
jgi:hypothetical protein